MFGAFLYVFVAPALFPAFSTAKIQFFSVFCKYFEKKSIYSELFGANPLILNSIRYFLYLCFPVNKPNGSAWCNPVRRIYILSNARSAVFCTASVFLIPLQFLVRCRSCRRAGYTTARREPPSQPSPIPLPAQ